MPKFEHRFETTDEKAITAYERCAPFLKKMEKRLVERVPGSTLLWDETYVSAEVTITDYHLEVSAGMHGWSGDDFQNFECIFLRGVEDIVSRGEVL